MPYQSRVRQYKSRREKNENTRRITLRILFFVGIVVAGWAYLNRVSLWDWFRTYFY